MCRSRRQLSNAYSLAKFGFDTAENEPSKVCPDLHNVRDPAALRRRDLADGVRVQERNDAMICNYFKLLIEVPDILDDFKVISVLSSPNSICEEDVVGVRLDTTPTERDSR